MKKVILIFGFIAICLCAGAQKIMDNKKNVQELKEAVEMYAVVVLTPKGAGVGINEIGSFTFVDEKNSPVDLRTTAQILNFMHKHGWLYINTLGGDGATPPQYIFKKRE